LFHPHVHVHAADGVFGADGTLVELPPIPEALLEGGFRRAVLDFLVGERAISEELRSRGARGAKTTARATAPSAVVEVLSEFAQRAKAAWARLIRKVYEADPLE
jgi:hypothetical protein